jgi:hypothetical protein
MVFDSLAKLNRTSRYAVFAAMIIIATIAMYVSIVAPHVGYLSAAQRYEYVVSDMAKKKESVGNTVKGRKKELQKLQEQCLQLEGTLFSPEKAKEFFSDLRPLAEQAGCTVHSLRFPPRAAASGDGQSKNLSGVVAKRAILSVSGAYSNIISLTERLQSRAQKVWIDSLDVQALNDGSNQLRCDISIVIYTIQNKESTDE